jgi:hypothetical protein
MRHHTTAPVQPVAPISAVAPVHLHVASKAARIMFALVRAGYQRGLRLRAAGGAPMGCAGQPRAKSRSGF